jgi:glycosyltransferase involved in cell wall biosynthesis
VVGSGPLRGALVDRAAALRLDGRLRIDGALQQRDVRDLYGRASAFVLPSRVTSRGDRDTLPVAIVEALAAGVPVVTTPVAGIPEVIRDEETGLLVPPDDAASLADALERVLTDADLRSRLGDGAREVARRFELSTTVSELRALFAARGPA